MCFLLARGLDESFWDHVWVTRLGRVIPWSTFNDGLVSYLGVEWWYCFIVGLCFPMTEPLHTRTSCKQLQVPAVSGPWLWSTWGTWVPGKVYGVGETWWTVTYRFKLSLHCLYALLTVHVFKPSGPFPRIVDLYSFTVTGLPWNQQISDGVQLKHRYFFPWNHWCYIGGTWGNHIQQCQHWDPILPGDALLYLTIMPYYADAYRKLHQFGDVTIHVSIYEVL